MLFGYIEFLDSITLKPIWSEISFFSKISIQIHSEHSWNPIRITNLNWIKFEFYSNNFHPKTLSLLFSSLHCTLLPWWALNGPGLNFHGFLRFLSLGKFCSSPSFCFSLFHFCNTRYSILFYTFFLLQIRQYSYFLYRSIISLGLVVCNLVSF